MILVTTLNSGRALVDESNVLSATATLESSQGPGAVSIHIEYTVPGAQVQYFRTNIADALALMNALNTGGATIP